MTQGAIVPHDLTKQVDASHYRFQAYVTKARWNSMWHQLDEAIRLQPDSILEIGPGPGVFKKMASLFDVKVETVDIDPELKPDHIGSATSLALEDESYDLVCAFQMLEHLPYEKSLEAFAEMARVSRRYVMISLPDAKIVWAYLLHVPKLGRLDVLVPRPSIGLRTNCFDGEHYWEINKKGFSLRSVIKDYSRHMCLRKTYRVPENPYHRFFIFEREHWSAPGAAEAHGGKLPPHRPGRDASDRPRE